MHSFQNFHSSTVLVPRQIRTESDKVLIQKNRRLEVWRFKILLRCACTALDHQCLVLATFKISEIQTYTNWLLYAFENTHTLRRNFYAITFSSKQIQQCQMLLKVSAKCKHAKTWPVVVANTHSHHSGHTSYSTTCSCACMNIHTVLCSCGIAKSHIPWLPEMRPSIAPF